MADKDLKTRYSLAMEIRRATRDDLPRIREIYNHAVRERTANCDEDEKSLENRSEWFEQFNDAYPNFVLVDGSAVAGYGCLMRYSHKSGYRFTVENSIYIAAESRGRGLGRKMLTHLIQAARERNYNYIEARVFAHNPTSLALHESLGFRRVGTQQRIANLDGTWYDNTILSLHLNGAPQPQVERVFTNSPWEKKVGYCRAIRRGNFIAISGTTSIKDGEIHGVGDAYTQATRCFEIIEDSLKELGASLSDVLRTRMFVTDIKQWERIAQAHSERFATSPPATSMYEVKALIDPRLLIEVEADAMLGDCNPMV
jgi:L-amino acid N-acyltransferase YncA